MRRALAVGWVCLLVASRGLIAQAADGALEISQTCAAVGCFPGDDPGWPVTITGAGRAYVLTSDLLDPEANVDAIRILAPHVTLDLGGFGIAGRRLECGGPCAQPGSQSGIVVIDGDQNNGVEIRNGTVALFEGNGILLGTESVARKLRVRDNGGVGITASSGCAVIESIAELNGSNGIRAGDGCLLSGNTASLNGVTGIVAGIGSTVRGNIAFDNGTHGIQASDGTLVHGNSVYRNNNSGLSLSDQAGYRENAINDNGATAPTGVNMGGNSCNGSIICP